MVVIGLTGGIATGKSEASKILEELGADLNFNILFEDTEEFLNKRVKNLNNYLIISNKKYSDIQNQFVLDNLPINVFKLI